MNQTNISRYSDSQSVYWDLPSRPASDEVDDHYLNDPHLDEVDEADQICISLIMGKWLRKVLRRLLSQYASNILKLSFKEIRRIYSATDWMTIKEEMSWISFLSKDITGSYWIFGKSTGRRNWFFWVSSRYYKMLYCTYRKERSSLMLAFIETNFILYFRNRSGVFLHY